MNIKNGIFSCWSGDWPIFKVTVSTKMWELWNCVPIKSPSVVINNLIKQLIIKWIWTYFLKRTHTDLRIKNRLLKIRSAFLFRLCIICLLQTEMSTITTTINIFTKYFYSKMNQWNELTFQNSFQHCLCFGIDVNSRNCRNPTILIYKKILIKFDVHAWNRRWQKKSMDKLSLARRNIMFMLLPSSRCKCVLTC